ncbi:MAG: sulfite exporter TauE/SafE family protein [Octadecabacter sp.]
MDGTLFWAWAMIAAFCVGMSKGGAPAFGALAVPILSLVISPVAAAGLLLPVFLFSDIFGVWAYRKNVNWALVRMAVIGVIIGTSLGWATAHLVSDQAVRVLIGAIGLVFSLNFLRRSTSEAPARAPDVRRGIFWTTVAGFTSFVSHAGAPPWQVWVLPQKLSKMVFAGTSAVAFAIMNAAKIIPYYHLGQLQADNLRVTMILFVPAIIGVFVAYRLIRVLQERVFYRIVTWMLLAVSIKLIWDGILG